MHGILFFWLLVQLPVVIFATNLYTLIPDQDTQDFINEGQSIFGASLANWAAAQFLLMGLMSTISMAVTHFKRHHQQMI